MVYKVIEQKLLPELHIFLLPEFLKSAANIMFIQNNNVIRSDVLSVIWHNVWGFIILIAVYTEIF